MHKNFEPSHPAYLNHIVLTPITTANDFILLIKLKMEMGNVSKRQQPTEEQKTAEGHQWVFNAVRKSHT